MTGQQAGPKTTQGEFFGGVHAFFEGLQFLGKNPRWIPLVILPFCLSVLVFVSLFFVAVWGYADFKDWILPPDREGFWWGLADVAANLVGLVIYGFVCVMAFVTVTSLITSPFSEFLSQQVEEYYGCPRNNLAAGAGVFVTDTLRGLKHETIRLAIFIALWLVCLPVFFIPLVNVIYPFLMGFISIRYLAWDAVDYSLSRRQLHFREKTAFLKRRRARTFGFGSISFAMLAIPLTTVFVLPLNAIGGTVLFCKIAAEEGEPRRGG
ncbi:MAG: EI24 domain-containing protein [Planctomycetota bacterium]